MPTFNPTEFAENVLTNEDLFKTWVESELLDGFDCGQFDIAKLNGIIRLLFDEIAKVHELDDFLQGISVIPDPSDPTKAKLLLDLNEVEDSVDLEAVIQRGLVSWDGVAQSSSNTFPIATTTSFDINNDYVYIRRGQAGTIYKVKFTDWLTAWFKDPPIPTGYQSITRSIFGVDEFTFDGNPDSPFTSSDPNIDVYTQYSANLVFLKADYPILNNTGERIKIASQTNMGYYTDVANPVIKDLGYQWGTILKVNGNIVVRNGDSFALNKSGHNSFIADTIDGIWISDGNDLTVEIILYLTANSTQGSYTQGDMVFMDMAQIGVTMTLEG